MLGRAELGVFEDGRSDVDIKHWLIDGGVVAWVTRIVDDERNLERFFVVRPLSCETAIAFVVAVIAVEDDNGVVSETKILKGI